MFNRAIRKASTVAGLAAASCLLVIRCTSATDESRTSKVSRQSSAGGGSSNGGGGSEKMMGSNGQPNRAATGGFGVTLGVGTGSDRPSESCQPGSCHPTGGDYCGSVGDGCGSSMDCGACPKAAWVCEKGLCKGGPDCVARTSCTEGGARFCGKIGDDCGGELDCGNCDAPHTCGGTGTPNLCGDPNCQPISCSLPVGQYCGIIGDGCGRSRDCGACPGDEQCGGDGFANTCPGSGSGFECKNLQCSVARCPGGGTTSLSGVVYDPAGVNPLYNVTVYIPNAPLDPMPTGISCEQCNTMLSGEPIATALTDAKGHFLLERVPTGTDIPLVMQVGRWRRKITVPKVVECKENVLNDKNFMRLPRNKSEGDIPRIAITTGGADALECLIPRIGVDLAEITTDAGNGRIHLYAGGIPDDGTTTPAGPELGVLASVMNSGRGATSMPPSGALPQASKLWGDSAKMRGYDIVMYSCEGGDAFPAKDSFLAKFQDYVDHGGRAFLSHYHYVWLKNSTTFQRTANYTGDDVGKILANAAPVVGTINTSFPKGAALADWLVAVGATTTRGQIQIYESRNSVTTVISPTQDWISLSGSPQRTQYLTFNTPVGVSTEQQCGRVVFTDLHVGASVVGPPLQGGDVSNPTIPFSQGCSSNPMSPQAKALEFIFFDLSACLTPDFQNPLPPEPPPVMFAAPPVIPPVPAPPPPPAPVAR